MQRFPIAALVAGHIEHQVAGVGDLVADVRGPKFLRQIHRPCFRIFGACGGWWRAGGASFIRGRS